MSARKAQTQRPGSEASKQPSQGSEAAAAVLPSSTASEAMRPPAAAVRPSPSEAGAAVRPSPSGGDVKAGASGASGAAISPSVLGWDQPARSGTEVAVNHGVWGSGPPAALLRPSDAPVALNTAQVAQQLAHQRGSVALNTKQMAEQMTYQRDSPADCPDRMAQQRVDAQQRPDAHMVQQRDEAHRRPDRFTQDFSSYGHEMDPHAGPAAHVVRS